jgi:hypothetical protein
VLCVTNIIFTDYALGLHDHIKICEGDLEFMRGTVLQLIPPPIPVFDGFVFGLYYTHTLKERSVLLEVLLKFLSLSLLHLPFHFFLYSSDRGAPPPHETSPWPIHPFLFACCGWVQRDHIAPVLIRGLPTQDIHQNSSQSREKLLSSFDNTGIRNTRSRSPMKFNDDKKTKVRTWILNRLEHTQIDKSDILLSLSPPPTPPSSSASLSQSLPLNQATITPTIAISSVNPTNLPSYPSVDTSLTQKSSTEREDFTMGIVPITPTRLSINRKSKRSSWIGRRIIDEKSFNQNMLSEHNDSELNETEHTETENDESKHNESKQNETENDESEQNESKQNESEKISNKVNQGIITKQEWQKSRRKSEPFGVMERKKEETELSHDSNVWKSERQESEYTSVVESEYSSVERSNFSDSPPLSQRVHLRKAKSKMIISSSNNKQTHTIPSHTIPSPNSSHLSTSMPIYNQLPLPQPVFSSQPSIAPQSHRSFSPHRSSSPNNTLPHLTTSHPTTPPPNQSPRRFIEGEITFKHIKGYENVSGVVGGSGTPSDLTRRCVLNDL